MDRSAFALELARAEARAKRSATALGEIWRVLDPMFEIAIYFFLFTVIRTGRAADELPALIGTIFLFRVASDAMTGGAMSIRQSERLMLNSAFPRAVLPVSAVLKSLDSFVPRATIFAIMFVLAGGKAGVGMFVMPLLFATQVVLMLGVSLMMATVVTLIKDTGNLVRHVTRILFFTTPVIFPITSLGHTQQLMLGWQPFFPLFASYQTVLRGGTPSPALLIQSIAWAGLAFYAGARFFLRHEHEFASRMLE